MLYHITTRTEAERVAANGGYEPAAFAREGFIHCSYRDQVVAVANRLFRGRTDLVLLEIDPAKLTCRIVDENLEGGTELYPHVYGRVPTMAIARMLAFDCGPDGRFAWTL